MIAIILIEFFLEFKSEILPSLKAKQVLPYVLPFTSLLTCKRAMASAEVWAVFTISRKELRRRRC